MATPRTNSKGKTSETTETTVALKRAGKTAAHFWDEELGGFVKDMYVPIEEFNALGKPEHVKVTIEPIA